MSEGAEALVGGMVGDEAIESMEAMVEGTLVLCDCPAERTGGVHVSLDLLDELGLTVMTIDGDALPWRSAGGARMIKRVFKNLGVYDGKAPDRERAARARRLGAPAVGLRSRRGRGDEGRDRSGVRRVSGRAAA